MPAIASRGRVVDLYAISGRHFHIIPNIVVGSIFPHIPSIPCDMFPVNFPSIRMGFALRDYLLGRFVLPDLLPDEISDLHCFLGHSSSPVSVAFLPLIKSKFDYQI